MYFRNSISKMFASYDNNKEIESLKQYIFNQQERLFDVEVSHMKIARMWYEEHNSNKSLKEEIKKLQQQIKDYSRG